MNVTLSSPGGFSVVVKQNMSERMSKILPRFNPSSTPDN
eukprot:CAMPEP_0180307758 /NCGR_PEP_ID=MMETSP0988-20121125/28043_1 /TAXON_ID=697907 /ORGANISM="non described non described, Strain CCMP2293" /LENGTH=38 /DNA_ID= /DNA_START= /DNA_END= /DNA_ORIENTATION=